MQLSRAIQDVALTSVARVKAATMQAINRKAAYFLVSRPVPAEHGRDARRTGWFRWRVPRAGEEYGAARVCGRFDAPRAARTCHRKPVPRVSRSASIRLTNEPVRVP
jgi:hypothetical protein